MIDFNTQQLSWILVGALGIGGTGYMSMTKEIDNLNTKVAVTQNNTENISKNLEELKTQLNRIEEKLSKK